MTKNEKFIKAYIEFYYGVKIKKAKIWGLFGTPINTTYYVITKKEQLDHLTTGYEIADYKLFNNIKEIYYYFEGKDND